MFNKSPAVDVIDQHKTSMDTMKEFVELVKNPEKIIAAHEAVRKEHTLTTDQAIKYSEALAFSEKYEGLATAYNQRVEELEAAERAHAENVAAHKIHAEQQEALFGLREDELSAGERQLAADRKKLEEDAAEQERKYSELRTPIDDDIEQNRKDKEANAAEKLRLEKLAKKLDRRDKSIKAAVDSSAEDEEIAA